MPERQDVHLFFDQDMPAAAVHEFAGGTAAVFSHRCPSKESPNEDAAALIPYDERNGVLVVTDGMGGGRAGEQASRAAIQALGQAVTRAAAEGDMLRTGVLNGIEQANIAVQELGVGAATTLALAEVIDGAVRTYHVGDSMILLVGGRGKVKLQTVSHSPVGFAVEAGLLDELEAMLHEDRNLVSNIVGVPDMRIEVGSHLKLAPRDTLLLATDGLFDNLHTEEIVQRIYKTPLENVARRLVDDALHRMTHHTDGQPCKPDDLTFVAYRPRSRGGSREPRRHADTEKGNTVLR